MKERAEIRENWVILVAYMIKKKTGRTTVLILK